MEDIITEKDIETYKLFKKGKKVFINDMYDNIIYNFVYKKQFIDDNIIIKDEKIYSRKIMALILNDYKFVDLNVSEAINIIKGRFFLDIIYYDDDNIYRKGYEKISLLELLDELVYEYHNNTKENFIKYYINNKNIYKKK